MSHFNYSSDIHRLSTQQQNSLEKHQRMIDDAIKWQRYRQSPPTTTTAQPAMRMRLRPVFAALISIFSR